LRSHSPWCLLYTENIEYSQTVVVSFSKIAMRSNLKAAGSVRFSVTGLQQCRMHREESSKIEGHDSRIQSSVANKSKVHPECK